MRFIVKKIFIVLRFIVKKKMTSNFAVISTMALLCLNLGMQILECLI